MRLIVIALSMALLLGCSYQPFQSDALLDKIEQQVTIPPYQSGDFTLALGEFDLLSHKVVSTYCNGLA